MKVTDTVEVDIIGAPEEIHLSEFHVTLQVVPVQRTRITIVEERNVHSFWEEAYAGHPVMREGFRGVDESGQEWQRDWDGWHSDGPGQWTRQDGIRAETVRLNNGHLNRYTRDNRGWKFI